MSDPGGSEIQQLFDGDAGTWLVKTISGSMHLVDLGARTITRYKATEPDPDAWPSAALRRDADPVRLVTLHCCHVGDIQGMVATIEIREDGALTFRRTTPVTSISRVAVEADAGDLAQGA